MKKIVNEQLDITNVSPVRSRFYDYKNFTYPWHFHSQYELMYVDEGEGYCVIGDNILNYSGKTLFFFGPDLPHWMQNNDEYYTEECPLRTKGVIVQFEKDFMQYSFSNYVQFAQLRELLALTHRGIRFPLEEYPEVQQLLRRMPDSQGIEQFVVLLQLFNELSGIQGIELGASPNYETTLGNFKGSKLDKIIAYINRHYVRDIPLEEVASFAAMNPASFCRFFKYKTGKTFKEYVIEMRVGYACKLLAAEHQTVAQICFRSGFDSLSHFNRCFRKVTGCSPTLFRARLFKDEKKEKKTKSGKKE